MANKNRGTNNDLLRRQLDTHKRAEQLNRIYRRDKGKCYFCKLPVIREEATRHHLMEFGEFKLEDVTPELKIRMRADNNVVLAHALCNNYESNGQKKIGSGLVHEEIEPFTHSMSEQLEQWASQNFLHESE